MKKITSLILALAMVFAMGVTVFAEDPAPADPNKFETTAKVNIPDIDVTVPTSAPLFINPLGFSVKVSDGTSATGDEEAYQVTKNQIVSPVFQIKNASPMKLSVSVIGSAVGPTGTGVFKMVGAPGIPEFETDTDGNIVKDDDGNNKPNTANQVFIYAYFDKVSGEGDEATMKDPAKYDATDTKAYALVPKALGSSDKPQAVGEIAAASDGEPTILGFKFLGEVNKNAAKDYVNDQTANITLTFTFKPVA